MFQVYMRHNAHHKCIKCLTVTAGTKISIVYIFSLLKDSTEFKMMRKYKEDFS